MTREETLKILSVLKVAYPESYRNLDKETLSATINLWQSHFKDEPYLVVSKALNELIAKVCVYPPKIVEVNNKIAQLKERAKELIYKNELATKGIACTYFDILSGKNVVTYEKYGEPVNKQTLKECFDILGGYKDNRLIAK